MFANEMNFPRDLLAQAAHLAALDPTRPKQANLRRSISSAYYALFHLLVAESCDVLSPKTPAGLAARIGRAFSHADMRQACKAVAGSPSKIFSDLMPAGFSPSLRNVAQAFVALQEARHVADYDTALAFSRTETDALVKEAELAFSTWESVQGSDEASVFLAALLLHRQWSK